MVGSKRATSADRDKKAKMPKKLLTLEENFVPAAKQRDRCGNLKLKQT
jgi:hypothetical protein